jgi:hypothetical protein
MSAVALFLSPLFFTLIPIWAGTWARFFGTVVVCGGLLAWAWLEHGIDMKLGDFLAVSLLWLATIGFAATSVARAIGLVLQGRGFARRRLWRLDALGLLAIVAVLMVPYQYGKRVARRAPAETCLARPIPVTVAGQEFRLPHSGTIGIHVGEGMTDALRLFVPAEHREVCRRTQDGTRPLAALAINIRLRSVPTATRACEGGPATDWERQFCTADSWNGPFPQELLLYEDGTIHEGASGRATPLPALSEPARAGTLA